MFKKTTYSLLILLIGTISTVFGQYTSNNGWFEVDFLAGCVGATINVTLTASAPGMCYDPSSGIECDTFWGDGTQDKTLSHTYTEAGVFTLEILFDNTNGFDEITISINESNPPEFELYACTNRRVAVSITDTQYDNYIINDGLGNETTVAQGEANTLLTFTDNTPKSISVRGIDNDGQDNCTDDTKNITPLNALPAGSIDELSVISDTELVLDYSLADNVLYQLQIVANGGTSYAPLKIIPSTTQLDTIRNLDLINNYYCFRIATINACDNTIDNLSSDVCSIALDLNIADGANQLSWITSDPQVSFQIIRNQNTTPLVTVASSERNYDDQDIICNTDYCYSVIGTYNNGIISRSNLVCGTSFSTQPPGQVMNISSIVDGESIYLEWEPPAANAELSYSLIEIVNGRNIQIATVDTTNYLINNLNTNISHCYVIFVSDACDNLIEQSIESCSIAINSSISKSDEVNLTWNAYSGWENGTSSYRVEKSYDGVNFQGSTVSANSYTEVDNSTNQVIYYRITALPNDALTPSVSNIIRVIKPNNIYFPNAFTPDGDNRNDTFELNGRFITAVEIKIFNRWGELIFVGQSLESTWDGTMNGTNLPEGTYLFRALLTDQAGREIEKEGTITLLRSN